MTTEAALEVAKLVAPAGSVAVVLAVLAYRSPQLVRELFAGVGGLLVTLSKLRGNAQKRKSRVSRSKAK
jgi:hypothetical protein